MPRRRRGGKAAKERHPGTSRNPSSTNPPVNSPRLPTIYLRGTNNRAFNTVSPCVPAKAWLTRAAGHVGYGGVMRLDYLVRSGIVKPRASFGTRDGATTDTIRRSSRIAAPVLPAGPAAQRPSSRPPRVLSAEQTSPPSPTRLPEARPAGSGADPTAAPRTAAPVRSPLAQRQSVSGTIPGPAPAKPIPAAVRPTPTAARPVPGGAIPSAVAAKPMPTPRVPAEDPSSRRRTKRKPGAIPCIISFAGLRLQLPARILDMSVGGACIHLPQAAKKAYDGDVDSLPDRLTLHIKSDHMAYEGRIAWRSNDRIGIQFTSPPRFTR